jgi:hypothetical protein
MVTAMGEPEIVAEYNHLMGELKGWPEECPGDRTMLVEMIGAVVSRANYLRELIVDGE